MYLPLDASKARVREAENARNNRLEIVKALSQGQISRRDLFKWGLFTTGGMIAAKHGLSVYAPSAYGQVPTGAPRSPLGTAIKFNIPMSRPLVQTPYPLVDDGNGNARWKGPGNQDLPELMAKKFSWHNEFSANPGEFALRQPRHRQGAG